MITALVLLVLCVLAGIIWINLKWGVVLLVIVSLLNTFLEGLLPVEADVVVGLIVVTRFLPQLFLHHRWKRSVLDAPVLILVLAGVVTLAGLAFKGSEFFGETATGVLRLILVMAMSLVVFQIIKEERMIQQVLQVFALTVTAMALLSIVLLLLGVSTVRVGQAEITVFHRWGGIQVRLGGFYEQPNTFATPLVLALPIAIAFSLIGKSRLRRVLWAAAAGICAAGLLLSQSRSGVLGALLGVLIMGLVLVKSGKIVSLLHKGFVLTFLVLIVLGATNMIKPVIERLSVEYQMLQLIGVQEPSRFVIWREAILLAYQNPLGYGAETKHLVGKSLGLDQKSLHNVFIDYLTSFGWLGFVGIFILAVTPVRRLWRFICSTTDAEWKVISAGLLAGLVGFWVHNLAHSMIYWVAVWLYFVGVAATLRLGYISKKGVSL